VLMTTGIDVWRTRRTGRRAAREELFVAGDELVAGSLRRASLIGLAGSAAHETPWAQLIADRESVTISALLKIMKSDNRTLIVLAGKLHQLALLYGADGPTPTPESHRHGEDLAKMIAMFDHAVSKAKL